METLPNQISLNLEIQSTSSPEAFLVSRIAQRAKEKEKTMPVTSGPKCFELFEKSDRATSWGRMFMDSLLGTADLFSTRCVLTWKLKVTPYGRLLFQLQPSALPTEETACGLLPTPLANAREQINFDAYDSRMERLVEKGYKPFTMPLDQMALRGLLPTPKTQDSRHALRDRGKSNLGEEMSQWEQDNGKGSRLNPRFVAEMMGFPPNWTELPFLNGETKA